MAEDSIVCESFDLTDSIREEVNEKLAKIRQYTKKQDAFSVFIAKTSDHTYSVVIKGHLGKKDVEGRGEENDFHQALKKAKEHVIRHIVENKEKRISDRHHSNEVPPKSEA